MQKTGRSEIRSGLISNVYYTLQVHRCGPEGDQGKWNLTVTQCASDGVAVAEQRVHLERIFDSDEEAFQYGSTWASAQRAAVIHEASRHLRSDFFWYGFDVSAYSDDQLRMALLAEAANEPSGMDLFVRAFGRLKKDGTEANHG